MSADAKTLEQEIVREVSRVVVGKEDKLRLITAALLADGHILLDDLPGVGKTTLVKALSRALGCRSSRVQFTPDLLPSDVTGMNIYDRASGAFRRLDGPVMTNLRQVTLDGETEALPKPFFVLATQNPVESESTFRLPAAQLDRFMMCLTMGYPGEREEADMLRLVGTEIPFDRVQAVTSPEELCRLQDEVQHRVAVSDAMTDYIVAIAAATRASDRLRLGASPRASRALYRASRALAAIEGRDFVTPDDMKTLAAPVLCHRLVLSSRAAMAGQTAQSVLQEIVASVPVPPQTADVFHA